MYLHVWRASFIIPAIFTTVASAAIGMSCLRVCHGNTLLGAIVGGGVGGIVAAAIHKVCCGRLVPDMFEHEGLDLIGYTLMLSPLAALLGVVIGTLTWVVAWFVAFVRQIDQQAVK